MKIKNRYFVLVCLVFISVCAYSQIGDYKNADHLDSIIGHSYLVDIDTVVAGSDTSFVPVRIFVQYNTHNWRYGAEKLFEWNKASVRHFNALYNKDRTVYSKYYSSSVVYSPHFIQSKKDKIRSRY